MKKRFNVELILGISGKSYQSPYYLVANLIEQLEITEQAENFRLNISDISSGYVIRSGGEVMLCSIENSGLIANAMRQIIDDSLFLFLVVFRDIYHYCWQNDYIKSLLLLTVRLPMSNL